MIRFLAKRQAKRKYVWRLELEAAEHEINSQLAAKRAEQIAAEADAIEESMKANAEEEAAKTMTKKEKYESGKEREAALKILAEKRETAKSGQQTAEHFRRQAANSRIVADKIRHL